MCESKREMKVKMHLNVDENEQYRSTRDQSEDNSSNASSSTASRGTTSYGLTTASSSRENHFLSAAKKWAAYDKTPYISPFARDSWKRTHRKFNYSRFSEQSYVGTSFLSNAQSKFWNWRESYGTRPLEASKW